MTAKRIEGRIVRFTGSEVWVDVGGQVIPALLRGRFRQKGRGIQVVAGDIVEVDLPQGPGTSATVEGLRDRETWLSKVSGTRDAKDKVIVANIDTLFFVISADEPAPNRGFIDRVLVSAEQGHNEVVLCLNKIDLAGANEICGELEEVYGSIGYESERVSARTGTGLERIQKRLSGGLYAFVGQSGVGKTSLLNAIDPDLNLKVGEIAGKTGRGRHTTTYSQLFPIKGGYMADTPGMQTFGYPGSDRAELANCFREFREYVPDCRFQPCTHSHEPDCAVKAAVDDERIAGSRYENYLSMLDELEARLKGRH
jgi:ribosome biogenesis GTPase